MTNQTPCRPTAAIESSEHRSNTPALPDRVAALELMLQQLLFVMDAQGTLRVEDLGQWLDTAAGRMRATGSVAPGPLVALEALTDMVCE